MLHLKKLSSKVTPEDVAEAYQEIQKNADQFVNSAFAFTADPHVAQV